MARGKERVRESESGRSVEVYAKNYITCCTPRAAGSPKNASSLSRPFYPTLSSPPALAAPAGPPTQPLRRRVSSAKELSSAKGYPITRHSRSARAEARSARAASPRRRRGVEGGERGGDWRTSDSGFGMRLAFALALSRRLRHPTSIS